MTRRFCTYQQLSSRRKPATRAFHYSSDHPEQLGRYKRSIRRKTRRFRPWMRSHRSRLS